MLPCVDGRLVCRSICSCIPDGHLHKVTYTRCRIDTINSPDDGHIAVRNMYRIDIYMKKNCASSWLFTKIACSNFQILWTCPHSVIMCSLLFSHYTVLPRRSLQCRRSIFLVKQEIDFKVFSTVSKCTLRDGNSRWDFS